VGGCFSTSAIFTIDLILLKPTREAAAILNGGQVMEQGCCPDDLVIGVCVSHADAMSQIARPFYWFHYARTLKCLMQSNAVEWYWSGLRLDEAMNPLAILCAGMYGEALPPRDGAPIRMVIPWKYGAPSHLASPLAHRESR
jgi:hypothetical protein